MGGLEEPLKDDDVQPPFANIPVLINGAQTHRVEILFDRAQEISASTQELRWDVSRAGGGAGHVAAELRV